MNARDAGVSVINDEMIQRSVLDAKDSKNAEAMNENGSVEFPELRDLALSYQKIFKIDNLVTLGNLMSLKLDNNVITTIEGIGHLTNLTWLDLSFNAITIITGLEQLTKLYDLSLYNNQIMKLENLDQLTKLEVLSVGNNALKATDGLLYLRELDNLKVLNLEGNPVCQDPEYRSFVLAHLDKLKYLDYTLLDEQEVTQAREQYQDELEEYKEKKILDAATKKREVEMRNHMALLKQANIYIIDNLFHDMFKEDSEIGKVAILPGLQNLKEDYNEKVTLCTDAVKTSLLENHGVMLGHISAFETLYENHNRFAQTKSIEASERYRKFVKRVFQRMKQLGQDHESSSSAHASTVTEILDEARVDCEKLHDQLLDIEMNLVDKSQQSQNELEKQLSGIESSFREGSTEHFRNVEELENGFYEAVSQLCANLMERISTAEDGEEDEFFSEECRALLSDRDALTNAISGSHDIHIGKLLAQEDAIREQASVMYQQILNDIKEKEWKRNRSRVAEIIHLKEKNLLEIQELCDELNRTEENYY